MLVVEKSVFGLCKNCLKDNGDTTIFEVTIGNTLTGNQTFKICQRCAQIILNGINAQMEDEKK